MLSHKRSTVVNPAKPVNPEENQGISQQVRDAKPGTCGLVKLSCSGSAGYLI